MEEKGKKRWVKQSSPGTWPEPDKGKVFQTVLGVAWAGEGRPSLCLGSF